MNEKPLYLTIKRSSDYLIFLGPKLTSKPFEEILVAHWDKSQQTSGRIVFVMEEVQWASLIEVIILTMWALHLRKQGKNVAVCLPFCGTLRESDDKERNVLRRKAVCSFLSRWQFPVRLDWFLSKEQVDELKLEKLKKLIEAHNKEHKIEQTQHKDWHFDMLLKILDGIHNSITRIIDSKNRHAKRNYTFKIEDE